MSITSELRLFAADPYTGWVPIDKQQADLRAMADRIDAEHEKQCAESWMRGHDAWAAIDRSDEMGEHGWIRLPLDADGVPWNVSDRDEDGNTVLELRLTSSGWCVTTDGGEFCLPSSYRHHHAPTVEDVLTEFGIDWEYESDCEDRAALLKEYAKRLTLVGDAS